VQPIDNGLEPLDQLWIAIPEFIKGLGLCLEYSKNVVRRLAFIDVGSQWVVAKVLSSSFDVLGQSYLEEGFEGG